MKAIGKLFGAPDNSAALAAQERALNAQRSEAQADQAEADQRVALGRNVRGRGLLSFVTEGLSGKLG